MACVADARLDKTKPSMRFNLVMPPGSGKSRVIIALMTLVEEKFARIKVFYTHQSLLEQDKDFTDRLCSYI